MTYEFSRKQRQIVFQQEISVYSFRIYIHTKSETELIVFNYYLRENNIYFVSLISSYIGRILL